MAGLGGPIPRDVILILAALLVTFTLAQFEGTRLVPALLRLTPLVWMRGFLWQLVTYPFTAFEPASFWFAILLLMLAMFGRDVYTGLGRRHFWRLLLASTVGGGVAAALVNLLLTLAGVGASGASGAMDESAFAMMHGPWVMLAVFVAAFATANRHATIYLIVIPIEARWYLALEVLFAFIAFLQTHDFAGFVGVLTAMGIAVLYIVRGGRVVKGGKGGLREMRLRTERWWIQRKLDRMKKKRGFRVIPGERGPGRDRVN
jgi:membrane associated rhomboid family serine protease